MIELLDAKCGYRKKEVLANISFSLNRGDAIGVLGVNGAGKSTLFKSILGLIPLIEGSIRIDGYDINEMSLTERARSISYVPQIRHYSYNFKGFEIVVMGRTHNIDFFSRPQNIDYEKTKEVFETLNITDLYYKDFTRMSGGEQQIILMARALVQDSKYIIMDEPTSNLDLSNQRKVLNVINILRKRNIGILMASHNPEHVFACCNRVVILSRGTCECGTTELIMTECKLSDIFGTKIKILKGENDDGCELLTCCLA